MTHRRVDANQAEIVALLRKVGAVVIQLTELPSVGFDLLVAHDKRLYAVEIKDGSKPPSERTLTANEQERMAELYGVGVEMKVIENKMQALELLGYSVAHYEVW